jgi:hypothetical protein
MLPICYTLQIIDVMCNSTVTAKMNNDANCDVVTDTLKNNKASMRNKINFDKICTELTF